MSNEIPHEIPRTGSQKPADASDPFRALIDALKRAGDPKPPAPRLTYYYIAGASYEAVQGEVARIMDECRMATFSLPRQTDDGRWFVAGITDDDMHASIDLGARP